MPFWLRKTIVGLVAVLTLGTIVPTSYLHINDKSSRDSLRSQEQQNGSSKSLLVEAPIRLEESQEGEEESQDSWQKTASLYNDRDELIAHFISFVETHAKDQGEEKFGASIQDKMGDTYNQYIVPKFGQVVAKVLDSMDDHLIRNLEVSHNPAAGTGERILHLYDVASGDEVVKFHVRRDQPPKDGYWFNFHYHIYTDGFEGHHVIDNIYWGKNTPPQWMA